ncbi:unnamed protein product [Danaus chrysippus]|uniref:Lysozyme n=1 Tax=Danaus chrysippus TaxID=151541 RepID=A0A8J2QBE5_9NEOP|nr:unnamed protein product [Danaus chrysippus]
MYAVALLTGTLIALAGARIYDRCELARDLLRLGVPREQVPTWVCIAFHESRYDTRARNPNSGDHGLLQISEVYWCGPGKACGLPCSALRDDDIADDVRCALQIYKEHTRLQGDGFMAWVVYPHYCRSNPKKYIVDCDHSVKSYSEKIDDNPRRAKTDFLNFTSPPFVDTSYDNRPLPNYLSINSLFQGNYFEEFEREYYNNNKRPFNWVNFKIDNIDDLKLPVTNRKGRVEFVTAPTATTYTTTTTARTTTTLEPALRGIKPPSPRRIESNQFRRRKMKLEEMTPKTDSQTELTTTTIRTTSSSTTISPEITKTFEQHFDSRYYYSSSTSPTTTSSTTVMPIVDDKKTTSKDVSPTYYYEHYSPLTTTVKPSTGVTSRTTSEIKSERTNAVTQSTTTQTPETTSATVSRRGGSRGFRFYSSPTASTNTTTQVISRNDSEGNKARRIEITTKRPEFTFPSWAFKKQTTVNNNLNASQNFQLNNNNNSSVYLSKISTSPPFKIDIKENKNDSSTEKTSKVEESVTNKSNSSVSSRAVSEAVTSEPSVTKPQFSSRGKSRYSQPTTERPIFGSPSSLATTPQTTKLSSVASETRSTQSIFDLYLKPTKRPTFQPFSFTPFRTNPHRLSIFSGGTTPLPPSAFLILSYPHFLYADFTYRNGVIGMKPFEEQHRIFVDLEPNTGTVIRGMKRAQFNVFMRPVTGISSTQNLRTTLMPIFWVEEGMQLPEDYVDLLTTRMLNRLRLVDILIPVLITLCALVAVLGVIILIRVRYVKRNIKNNKSSSSITPTSNTVDN